MFIEISDLQKTPTNKRVCWGMNRGRLQHSVGQEPSGQTQPGAADKQPTGFREATPAPPPPAAHFPKPQTTAYRKGMQTDGLPPQGAGASQPQEPTETPLVITSCGVACLLGSANRVQQSNSQVISFTFRGLNLRANTSCVQAFL